MKKIFIDFPKRKTDHFTAEKPSRHHLYQVIKVNMREEIHQHQVPSNMTHIISMVFLPKMHDLSQIMRMHLTNPNWEAFYKITDQYSSKVSGSWKTRERVKNSCRLEETKKEKPKQNCMQYGTRSRILEQKKDTVKEKIWNLNKTCSLVNKIALVLISHFWCKMLT